MNFRKVLGAAVLLLSAATFGKDTAPRQVVIESRILEVGPGILSADFTLNLGKVYANFPSDFAAGGPVSGTLAIVPMGKTDADRARNLAAIRSVSAEICGTRHTLGDALFVCPEVTPDRRSVTLKLEPAGLRSLLIEEPGAAKVAEESPAGANAFVLPSESLGGSRARIPGPFGGSFDRTVILIGGAPVHLVAESSRSCIFDVPVGPIGLTRIELSENGESVSGAFRIIGLRLAPPRPIIHSGDTTSFSAEVFGLAGLDRPLTMTLRNQSTGVVGMDGGDEQTVTIAPSNVSPDGTYAISRRLYGKRRGDYVVNVSIPWTKQSAGGEKP